MDIQSKPLVVADSKIPFLEELLGDSVRLVRLDPSLIDCDAVRHADALITRTRTRCNAALLDGSAISLIATATIGTDHIDFGYCNSRSIKVVSAPGCNAPAVAQYVWASILRLVPRDAERGGITVGVVGAGHVGSIVAEWGASMGFNMLLCDPPRRDREGGDGFVALSDVAHESDFITFHTPYTQSGPYPTHHMADKAFFGQLTKHPVIINSARGPIIDTGALLEAAANGKVSQMVIDCWEGEPDIDTGLLSRAIVATPHIAGYSIEGKTRASLAVARAVADHFHIKPASNPAVPHPGVTPSHVTERLVLESYDPASDTESLKTNPGAFEYQRNNYRLRHEIS